MSIISARDNDNYWKRIEKNNKQTKNKNKQTNKDRKEQGGQKYSERVGAKWLCCAFKLGFLQLICKASIIFKSNLELALSIIIKQRELYKSKHVVVECRYSKIFDLLSNETCYPFWYVPESYF